MENNIMRIKENKYYILYKRFKEPKDTIPRYVIYYSDNFGYGISKEFNYMQQARDFFTRATKEAIKYEKELINTMGVA